MTGNTPGAAGFVKDAERSFALAVEDMTNHSAEKSNGGVTVTISADTPSGGATLNTLGQLARAYEMEFYTGTLTHILRFGSSSES